MRFRNIYKETKENVELALLSLWAPGKHMMRAALKGLFKREPLMAEPVFQSIFPWKPTSDSNWESYLHKDVIQVQKDKAAARGESFVPFQHQSDSWKELKAGNSIVVTSGTGSGKTECFMLPVLSDLHSRIATPVKDTPVEAIFLYPLNALMQDQKDRLGKDCQKLGLRFAVYNRSLKERKATGSANKDYLDAEVRTRENVRHENKKGAPSCPQIILTNPSMLEYMLVRDSDQPIFERSKGKLKWIIIDEAHTYSGSAAVELSYLIRRVLSAFGVTRDQVKFVCTSATIGDKSQPQELTDFIETITGKYSPLSTNKLITVDGDRLPPPNVSNEDIEEALKKAGIPNVQATDVLNLRNLINSRPMDLSSMMKVLNFSDLDRESALSILDSLCEIKLGKDYLLMLRGHFFMRTIGGLFACINDGCSAHSNLGHTGFHYLTTYKGNGRCPHCGAPLFELVQCGECKEFIVECLENDDNELRISYSRPDDISVDSDDDGGDDDGTQGGQVDENWKLLYLAWYGNGRTYTKPHPDYVASKMAITWDGTNAITDSRASLKPWVTLGNKDLLYCPSCASGSGEDGSKFNNFRLSANWLNGTIAPALMKEGANATNEWGKYIAFTDSRQGTAINAKRFNIEAERAFARNKLVAELSTPQLDPQDKAYVERMMQRTGKGFDECLELLGIESNTRPQFEITDAANAIFDQRIFDHIDYEASQRTNSSAHKKDEDAYKTSLVRSVIGRRPVHLQNIENLGLVSIVYPSIDAIKSIPSGWNRANMKLEDWRAFLKISIDYVIRMGNHLQAPTDTELQYLRDSDRSTPFDPAKWPEIKNGKIKSIQHRLVLLLCAALGIKDQIELGKKRNEINTLLGEAWSFLEHNILTKVDITDKYYDEVDDNGIHIYDGWYYLDMSLSSTVCRLAIIENAFVCPVTSYIIDTIFRGYSPTIKGCVCPENISRYKVTPSSSIKMPIPGTDSFEQDINNLVAAGIWNDRHKYAYCKTNTGYLTAEHSGQQNRDRLDFYTSEFKSEPHKLNLLQCSTTMEMGVDIGDIDTVLMTNVPPSSANYMQRAGRAGRRGQSKAVSFSLCPNTSIGLQVFNNPMKVITGANPATRPVESSIVVQRHMNSFFIRQFLCDPVNDGVRFSKIHPWLGAGGYYVNFDSWLLNHKTDLPLGQTFESVFGKGRAMTVAIDNCRIAFSDIASAYQQTISDINNAIAAAGTTAKKDALSIQADALMNLEPKGYLAEQQFLPNADMPTGVVEFNHLDAYNYTKLNNMKKDLENCKQKLQQPGLSKAEEHKLLRKIDELESDISELIENSISSREIKIALSEYAPGQMIVIDERNYISAGIEWKNSLGQKQPWKYIYHCPTCGRYEYSDNPTLTQCPNCNSVFEGILAPSSTHCTYSIEPIRFRTDVNRGVNRKERTDKVFYDIQTILTEVDWNNSIKGYMCDLVGSEDSKGEIVFYNSGKGDGFNLCLDCGKMEVWKKDRTPGTWIHDDITEKDKACPCNNPYNNILLSGRFPTTFVSLRFYKDPSGTKFESDYELLYSLGVLLCRALTKKIGVSSDDVDFDVRQERDYASIFLYDTQKGGCGYSTRMLDPATSQAVFAEAKSMLMSYPCHCEDQVKGACVNCLIDRNSQRLEGQLSKYKLMEWFSRITINTGNLPQGVKAIPTPLKYLVTWLYSKQSVTSLTFCADASEMNLQDWVNKDSVMGRVLNECVNRGKTVKIMLANVPDPAKASTVDAIIPFIDLNQKFKNWNIDVQRVESLELTPGRVSALIVNDTEHYFTDKTDVLHFTADWGMQCTHLFEDGVIPSFKVGKFPSYNDIASLLHSGEIIRTTEFPAGTKTRIDQVFYILKQDLLKAGDEQVINDILRGKRIDITFSDTYVNSALAALMLVYLLKELRDMYAFTIASVTLNIKSPKRNCVNPLWNDNSYISFNFPNESDADSFIRDCFDGILEVTPIFSQTVPDHYRWIRLQAEGSSSYMEIRPDHGISGGWQSSEKYISADYLDGSTEAELKRGVEAMYYLLLKK